MDEIKEIIFKINKRIKLIKENVCCTNNAEKLCLLCLNRNGSISMCKTKKSLNMNQFDKLEKI